MMAMGPVVVHQVEVLLEVVVEVVWPKEVEVRLCVTTVTRSGISRETAGTQLRHVGIAGQ